MKTIQFEQLNTHSLAEGKCDTAIVSLASCESHGDHLPFGTRVDSTKYGATGAASKATKEKGEKVRGLLVDCLVGFPKRMDEQNRNIRTREG